MIRLTIYHFRGTTNSVLRGLFAIGLVASTAIPALGSGTFAKTGNMNVARISHTATLLLNGGVLVAGGNGSSAELYNPATGSRTLTGSMTTARDLHQAVDPAVEQIFNGTQPSIAGTERLAAGSADHGAALLYDSTGIVPSECPDPITTVNHALIAFINGVHRHVMVERRTDN